MTPSASTHRSSSVLLSIPEDLLQRVADRLSKAQIFDASSELRQAIARAPTATPAPIDMVLHCPDCGLQHIDTDDSKELSIGGTLESGTVRVGWDNPPHKSHLCRKEDGGCGCIWRPADVPTNGVKAIKTVGKADRPGEKHGPKWGVQAVPLAGSAQVPRVTEGMVKGLEETAQVVAGVSQRLGKIRAELDGLASAGAAQVPIGWRNLNKPENPIEWGERPPVRIGRWEAVYDAEPESPVSDAPLLDCDVAAQPLRYSLRDYHHAPGDGPLHATWNDKPHRLVYDLVAAVKFYAALSKSAAVSSERQKS